MFVSIAGQQIQQLISLESGYVDAALLSPPVTLGAQKKGFYKVLDVGGMVDMPGGGLTALAKTIQERPVETKRVIRSLQQAKDEMRKSKPKTLDLIVKLLKMDKEAASETYDQFLTTLSPTGILTRAAWTSSSNRFNPRAVTSTAKWHSTKSPMTGSQQKWRRNSVIRFLEYFHSMAWLSDKWILRGNRVIRSRFFALGSE